MNSAACLRSVLRVAALAALLLAPASRAFAAAPKAKAPDLAYLHPAGAAAGTTVDVIVGGCEWTPDMQYFVHRPGVQLVPTGLPGPVRPPDPPFWFGSKSTSADPPLARETPARLVIPADCPAGPVFWQAANANGSTATGVFIVSRDIEVVEAVSHKLPQLLPALPVTVSGRVSRIEEIDHYQFVAPRDGPVTCQLDARRLGSKFHGAIEVRDPAGRLIADAFDTEGNDAALTFAARKDTTYTVGIRDVDHRGDRSYCYRLKIADAPRVLAALPAGGRRGQTRSVEFLGIGVATGQNRLESVKRDVKFPDSPDGSFEYRLETPFGKAASIPLIVSDLEESAEPAHAAAAACPIAAPIAITGALDEPSGEDLYTCQGKKGDVWAVTVEARAIGSPIDPLLVVRDAAGKELARADDVPGTCDCELLFSVPADGPYTLAVADLSGTAGSRAATYRLIVEPPKPDFALQATVQKFDMVLGDKAPLAITAVRRAGFKEPISLTFSGLPEGVSVVGDPVIPGDKAQAALTLQSTATGPAIAAVTRIVGTSKLGGAVVSRPVLAPAAGNLIPRTTAERTLGVLLVATTLKPVCSVEPLERDGGRSVHRGTSFPAPIVIERIGDFKGEVVMQMASAQSYRRQGINGSDVVVPPGVTRAIYPCEMPEWLETTRTSRMAVVGVAKVADPKGNVRYSVSAVQGQVTMKIEGALLKLIHDAQPVRAPIGKPFSVSLKISRAAGLAGPTRLELVPDADLADQFKADSISVPANQGEARFSITPQPGSQRPGRYTLAIRATVIDENNLPVVSSAKARVEIVPGP